MQSGHFKMSSINREQIAVKYRYCEFNFKFWHSLTFEKYSSRPLVQSGLSKNQSKLMVKPSIIVSLSACKKVAQSINSFLKYGVNILPIFDHSSPKHLEVNFTFPEFVSTYEKSVCSFNLFLRYSGC